MKVLITGMAGFIGHAVTGLFIENEHNVIGIDNENDYYDVELKRARIRDMWQRMVKTHKERSPLYYKADILDTEHLDAIAREHPDISCIIHLAAQAGVRYSMEHPITTMKINVMGFANILEVFKNVKKVVYASSSSVYGDATPPYTENTLGCPMSVYASSKRMNEIQAMTHEKMTCIPCIGMRFFSVYGPWGRPDMAVYKFLEKMLTETPIDIYNNGNLQRDWTYIDDISRAVFNIVESDCDDRIYNIGRGKSEQLMDFVKIIEEVSGIKANIVLKPMQEGDVLSTLSDTTLLRNTIKYEPKVNVREGIEMFVKWHRETYPNKW